MTDRKNLVQVNATTGKPNIVRIIKLEGSLTAQDIKNLASTVAPMYFMLLNDVEVESLRGRRLQRILPNPDHVEAYLNLAYGKGPDAH